MTTETLTPLNRKSFYNKAKLITDGNVTKLKSYETIVASYNHETKEMTVNGWYSATTARHINAFLDKYGFDTCTKADLIDYVNPKKEKETNPLGFMNAFLKIGDLTNVEETRENKIKYEERIVFATMKSMIPNWERPIGWNELSLDEKENRLTKLREISCEN